MYKCSCKEDPGAKVSGKEKEVVRYRETGETAGNDREGTCYIKSASEAFVAKQRTDPACLI
jgi:hypothetical protein